MKDKLLTQVVARYRKQAGATDFFNFIEVSDPRAAFNEAVANARHESGHGGYTGTIAEKSSFVIRNRAERTYDEAQDFAQDDAGNNDKWGPAFAIPVVEEKVLGTQELDITVAAPNDTVAVRQAQDPQVALKGKAKPGVIYTISIVRMPVQLTQSGVPEFEEVPLVGQDKPQFVVTYGTGGVRQTHNQPLLTKPAANQELKRVLSKGQVGDLFTLARTQVLGIYKVTSLPSKLAKWSVKVRVKASQRSTAIKGWLFYGMASS